MSAARIELSQLRDPNDTAAASQFLEWYTSAYGGEDPPPDLVMRAVRDDRLKRTSRGAGGGGGGGSANAPNAQAPTADVAPSWGAADVAAEVERRLKMTAGTPANASAPAHNTPSNPYQRPQQDSSQTSPSHGPRVSPLRQRDGDPSPSSSPKKMGGRSGGIGGSGLTMNQGNSILGRRSTKVHAPPGGHSSMIFGA